MVIQVEDLGKKYRLGAQSQPYGTLRESFAAIARAPLALGGRVLRRRGSRAATRPEFWALHEIDFEVRSGEVLGVIGRNGAGKSTLLKVLSRITEPTRGRVTIDGRIASLLEVGTGFHPELTGRENVFLNGAILGMSRTDILRKFDEIVAFAEVEQFVDTQVKHYSSGMYLRLAFSVAAHLEPEILVVDEVLAVGDAAFQAKCMGKMSDVSQHGRTVLLVSHNMGAITKLCTRCLLLQKGRLVEAGDARAVVGRYLEAEDTGGAARDLTTLDRRGKGDVRFTGMAFEDDTGREVDVATSGEGLTVRLQYEATNGKELFNSRVSFTVYDGMEQYLFVCSTEQLVAGRVDLPPAGTIACHIPRLPLTSGSYFLSPFMEVNHEVQDWIQQGVRFDVVDGDFHPGLRQYPVGHAGRGVLVPHEWRQPTPVS